MASRSDTATIEILPNQLLEIIFKDYLSQEEDIENCSKTCVRWNEIIASTRVFKDLQGNLNLSDLF